MADSWAPARTGRRGAGFWLALGWIACLLAAAASAELLPVAAPDRMDWAHLAARPGVAGHLLGTDGMGRDLFGRLIYGARVSLVVGILAPCFGLVLGGVMGVLAGFYHGILERIFVAVIETLLAFPRLILLLMVMSVFGARLGTLTVALGLVCVPAFARVARANTLKYAQCEFVLAARAGGAGDASIILREILPNVLRPMLVYLLVVMGVIIIAEGSLGFLGLSVPPPAASWGGMIAEGRDVLEEAPHVSIIPAVFMFLTILSFNVVGDRLREWYDPRESRL